jgi:hypothetical protein
VPAPSTLLVSIDVFVPLIAQAAGPPAQVLTPGLIERVYGVGAEVGAGPSGPAPRSQPARRGRRRGRSRPRR